MTPEARAREGIARAEEAERALEERLSGISRARITAFLFFVGPLLLIETSPSAWTAPLLAAGAIGFVAFVLLVRRHRRVRRARDRERLRGELHRATIARLERRWDAAPLPPLEGAPPDHPYAHDLDILGRGSLAHLLGRVGTAPGRAALRRALLDPLAPRPGEALRLFAPHLAPGTAPLPAPRELAPWKAAHLERQAGVRRLAREPDLMEALELAARSVEGSGSGGRTLAFLQWSEEEPWLASRRWALPAARALTLFNLATGVAWFTGWLQPPLWALGLAGAWGLNRWAGAEADRRLGAAEGGEGDPARWSGLLEVARGLPADDPLLDRIRRDAGEPGDGAPEALARLSRICDWGAVRYSSLVHFPLAAICAWDIHVLDRLERWQARHGARTGPWVLAVAELELVLALAGLHSEHPAWAFPEVVAAEGGGPLGGSDLGHPLLRPEACVGNDVELPEPGRLLLVTGSNMAGKTTLLRALGANQILALAGGPVAAGSFTTRPVLPWTAMRVSDSLTEGVSYFMAELRRLRRVVDAARAGPILFLLDEILQGTNTAERRTAARIVLGHLLATEGVGAVTTHDLTLADAPELRERSVNIHFREEVIEGEGGRRLDFDYRLRPGPATSRNALLLLELVGLGPEGPLPEN